MYASLPVCNGFLRFTLGAIPAELLTANIAAELLCFLVSLCYSKHFQKGCF